MKHEVEVVKGEAPFKTGERLTYIRYDSLEELLDGIVKGLRDQAIKDENKNKPKLAGMGFEAVEKTEELKEIVARMWKLSEPFMRDDINNIDKNSR